MKLMLSRLGELHQRRLVAAAAAKRHADTAEAEKHHRPGRGLRKGRATRLENRAALGSRADVSLNGQEGSDVSAYRHGLPERAQVAVADPTVSRKRLGG